MKKDLLAVLFVILLIAAAVNGTHIQSVDEYYLTHIDDITEDSETVTISIRCDTVLENYGDLDASLRSEEFVPPDGVILAETEYVLRPGDTSSIFWIGRCGITHPDAEYQGADKNSFGSVYVQGIHYLYEFSAVLCPAGCIGSTGNSPGYGCSNMNWRTGMRSNGCTPVIWAKMWAACGRTAETARPVINRKG